LILSQYDGIYGNKSILPSFTKEGELKKGMIGISNTEEKPDCKMKNAKK